MEQNEKAAGTARLQLISAMVIFGTIGIFVRNIPLSSGVIAFVRGIVGVLFLFFVTMVKKVRISGEAIRRNLLLLCLSGAAIGVNWILLFESYRYTTVAISTLCYYMAPTFVILCSPFLLKERLTGRKVVCVLVALMGMILVSGVLQTGISDVSEFRGILLGVGAAAFYAGVVLMNQYIHDITAYDKTIVQLFAAAVVLLPYVVLTEHMTLSVLTPWTILLLLVVGVIHTGFAYAMYFGSMKNLKAQTVAIFSYIDPIVAIILSALLLKEPMGILAMFGAVMILGSAFISELPEK